MITESIQENRNLRFDTSIKMSFISLLDQLSEEELIFLSKFSKGEYQQKSKNDIYQGGDNKMAIALDCLLAKGLLREGESTRNYCLCVTMLGREFIAYVEMLAEQNEEE